MIRLFALSLLSGCGLYFGPDYGSWTLDDARITSFVCMDEGFDDSPFSDAHALFIEKTGYPLTFDMSYEPMQWPSGPFKSRCTLDDKEFTCDWSESEWSATASGITPTDAGTCAQSLADPETESCWSQIMEANGLFAGEENQRLSVTYVYTLTCITGAECSLTPGEARCTAVIDADYSF